MKNLDSDRWLDKQLYIIKGDLYKNSYHYKDAVYAIYANGLKEAEELLLKDLKDERDYFLFKSTERLQPISIGEPGETGL